MGSTRAVGPDKFYRTDMRKYEKEELIVNLPHELEIDQKTL